MKKKETNGLIINYFGNSHVGLVRKENQDSFGKFPSNSNDVYLPKGQLFMVADGMGGHAHGREASKSAIEIVWQIYQKMPDDNIPSTLKLAFESANTKIYNSFKGNTKFQKMGTTATALVIKDNRTFIAHVGDSRLYYIGHNKIEQITTDHTVVAEMLKKGILSNEEAKTHPQKSVLNRAIGIDERVEVDVIKGVTFQPGDSFVLCTDGLANVTEEEIFSIVSGSNAEKACTSLINLANERGGKDNVTVQVIKVGGMVKSISAEPVKSKKDGSKKSLRYVLAFLFIIAFFTVGYIFRTEIIGLFSTEKSTVVSAKGYDEQSVTIDYNVENAPIENLFFTAERYFEIGKIDSAAIFYKYVLKKNPAHLSSLDGLYKISQIIKGNGDKFFDQGLYNEALPIYKRAFAIQPEDMELVELISYCESQLGQEKVEPVNEIVKLETIEEVKREPKVKTPEVEKVQETKLPIKEEVKYSYWKFDEVLAEDYKANGSDVTLTNNSRMKIVLNSYVLQGFTFEVNMKLSAQSNPQRAGLVVGYNWDDRTSTDSYFLFSIDKSNRFLLQKISDGRIEDIKTIAMAPKFQNENNAYKLKLSCIGNRITMYCSDEVLDSWDNAYLVIGKIGFYADQNTGAEFTKFTLTPIRD